MTQKKIVFFLFDLGLGGTEQVIVKLSNFLITQGQDVHILCVGDRDDFLNKLNNKITISNFGKKKILASVSPKKTLSGAIGSFIFSIFSLIIVANINFASFTFTINFLEPKFFFLSIIFSLIAQIGDLTISYFKRIEKIKDTGKVLPGHGGIFDRIDSLMFVIILAYFLYQFKIIP